MESRAEALVVTDISPRSRWSRPVIINLIALVVLLGGYGLAFAQMRVYETGITRSAFTIPGTIPTPVLYLAPARRQGDLIAVIVHGYSGSKDLMVGFGLELARMGVPSYLLDLPGHGESNVPLDAATTHDRSSQLTMALDEVVHYARNHSDVPQPKIMLVGHSLGTQVVGEYALSQPTSALAATVLISPILQDMPTTDHPANLLVIVGQNDIPSLIPLAKQLFLTGCGGGTLPIHLSHGFDNFAGCGDGTPNWQRRLYIAQGANHITILTDDHVYQQVNYWAASTDHIPYGAVQSNTRVAWLLLGALCAFLALFPLLRLGAGFLASPPDPLPSKAREGETNGNTGHVGAQFIASKPSPSDHPAPRDDLAEGSPLSSLAGEGLGVGPSFAIVAGSVMLTLLFLRGWSAAADALGWAGLRTPLAWMHMALADYAGSFALVLALALMGLFRLFRGRIPWPEWQQVGRQLALGSIVFLALYLTLAPLATFGWERFLLSGPRLLRFALLLVVNLPLFALIEGAVSPVARRNPWGGMALRLGMLLLLCVGYAGAILLDGSLFFLSLLIPIQALLFVVFTALAQRATQTGRATALASATCMAAIFAWAVAAVFPIIR